MCDSVRLLYLLTYLTLTLGGGPTPKGPPPAR